MQINACLALCMGVLACATAYGDASWEREQISATARFGEKTITAQYRFKNTGETTLTIQDLRTDCDCTTANAKNTIVPPGESADIDVRYNVGLYAGKSEKNISVQMMDSSGVFRKTLKLDVTIPSWIRVAPPLLTWNVGSTVESTSEIYLNPDLADHKLQLLRIPDTFICTFSRDPEDRLHYRLKITPKTNDKPCHHEIRLSLDNNPEQVLGVITLVVR